MSSAPYYPSMELRPSRVDDATALTSAWAVAARVCEHELARDSFEELGLRGVEVLYAEAVKANYPLLAALIAESAVFKRGNPSERAEALPVWSPWTERFIAVETSCRAAISIELERMLDAPDERALAQLARTQGRYALADLVEERLAGNLDGPRL
jgi:hypothetical protein